MTRISVIGMVVYKDGRAYTSVFYPEEGNGIPSECWTGDYEHHYWITENGKPPKDSEKCLCKKYEYGK